MSSKLEALNKRIDKIENKVGEAPSLSFDCKSTELTWNIRGNDWKLPLEFREFQKDLRKALFVDGYKRFYQALPRRSGKEVGTWSTLIDYCSMNVCIGAFVYPTITQGLQILWDGGMTLNGQTFFFKDFLPPCVDRERDINNSKHCITLPNGSKIWLFGTQNADTLRGLNPQIVVFSEYDEQDPQALNTLRPVFVENNGIYIIQTTWQGYKHGKELWDNVQGNDRWFKQFETADTLCDANGKRYITDKQIQEAREEGYPEHDIQEQFYMVLTKDNDKFFFGAIMDTLEKNVVNIKPKPNLALYTFWDLGVSDNCVVSGFQFIDNSWTLVFYIEENNKDFEYFINEIDLFCAVNNTFHKHAFIPHDGKNRDQKTLLSSEEYFIKKLKTPCTAIDRPTSAVLALQLTRRQLPTVKWSESCHERVFKCLKAHAKEWDAKNKTYRNTTKHDWTSHCVKSLQTFSLVIESNLIRLDTTKPVNGSYMDFSSFNALSLEHKNTYSGPRKYINF